MPENTTPEEWEARAQAEEAWMASPEGVRYELGADLIMAAVCHESLDTLITLAVAALPTLVREFVYDQCAFATIGGNTTGRALPPLNRWLILLDGTMAEQYDDTESKGIIAHEIAHAFLGHNMADPTLTIACEREAAEQTAAWGFEGIGVQWHDS